MYPLVMLLQTDAPGRHGNRLHSLPHFAIEADLAAILVTAKDVHPRQAERRIGPVCPFARNAEAAAIQLPEKEGINTCYSACFQNFEALAAKRMERMADLRPS